jgi:exopolysaccharide biosynthesis polyprenyl glycosylphosphotransferase
VAQSVEPFFAGDVSLTGSGVRGESLPHAAVPGAGSRRLRVVRDLPRGQDVLPGLVAEPGSSRRRSRTARWALLVDSATVFALVVTAPGPGWLVAVLLVWTLVVLNAAGGRYRDPVATSFLDELPGLAGRVLVACAVGLLVADALGRPLHARAVVVFLLAVAGGHLVSNGVVRRLRRINEGGRPTVIVGFGPVGRFLACAMVDHPECGRRPVGWLDDDEANPSGLSMLPLRGRTLPWLGDVRHLPRLMDEHPDLDVVVADSAAEEDHLAEVLRSCYRCPGEIYVLPRLHDLHDAESSEHVLGFPLVRLRRAAHRTLTWRLKRAIDVLLACVALLTVMPVLLLLASLSFFEGGPGVIFRQQRVGMDERSFDILKLRSMKPASAFEAQQQWSIVGDPRVGRVGRVLRTFSLDELPQLWNVLRGDMTLVGPRPERPYFVEEFSHRYPHYAARHRVPVGLTGLAQVNGLRGDTDIGERARFDNLYIARWSLWSDVKIMLRTVACFVTKAGS